MPDHDCKYEERILSMDDKLDQLLDGVNGTIDGQKRGLNQRVAFLENWKTFLTAIVGGLSLIVAGEFIHWIAGKM